LLQRSIDNPERVWRSNSAAWQHGIALTDWGKK